MTNIEVAIKHFEKRSEDNNGRLNGDEVLRALYFLRQCEEQNLKLIGMGYTVYDGEQKYHELHMKQMYEGGFSVY